MAIHTSLLSFVCSGFNTILLLTNQTWILLHLCVPLFIRQVRCCHHFVNINTLPKPKSCESIGHHLIWRNMFEFIQQPLVAVTEKSNPMNWCYEKQWWRIALSSYSYVQSLDMGRTLHFFAMTLVLINCKYRHKFVENELLKEKCKKNSG